MSLAGVGLDTTCVKAGVGLDITWRKEKRTPKRNIPTNYCREAQAQKIKTQSTERIVKDING